MFPFPSPDGTISSSSILLAQSLQHCVHSQNCSATDLFYQGSSQTVREWLNVAITRTLHQGEESLLELTKQICSFLQVKVQSSDGSDLGSAKNDTFLVLPWWLIGKESAYQCRRRGFDS